MIVDIASYTLLISLEYRLPGDLARAFEATGCEIPCWEPARFIQYVQKHCGPIGVQCSLRLCDGVGAQRFEHLLSSAIEQRGVPHHDSWCASCIDYDELQPSAA